MKNVFTILISFCALQTVFGAQLEIVTNPRPQSLFFGRAKKVNVVFYNAGDRKFADEVYVRIFQTSSATSVLLKEFDWEKLEVLPRQTILESAQIDFPAVKAKTKFLVQWLENSSVLGVTEVLVYPTNLLLELRPLAGDKAIGVFDPQNKLKPLLKNLRIDFVDLENFSLTNFLGKLAVIEPFQSRSQMPDDLRKQIKLLAKKNTAIVWIQPPPEQNGKLQPSFYSVPEKQIAVVIVQPDLVSGLADNPQSQLNLIYFCELALNPQPLVLPDLFIAKKASKNLP